VISDWKPIANLAALKARAALNADIRQFFAERGVMEVEVPLMGRCTVTDPFIESIRVDCVSNGSAVEHYLQTSPEFGMKRLLASPFAVEMGCIYSLGKAFRHGESGARHNPEFTMLEWYRLGFNDDRLMAEVGELIGAILPLHAIIKLSYRQLFQRYLNIDPHTAEAVELKRITQANIAIEMEDANPDTWLDLLVSHVLEPKLAADHPHSLVFIYDYPASQAALARTGVDDSGETIAKRFEGFYNGIELCNGYWELTDSAEQARRFAADITKRQQLGLPMVAADPRLIEALASGLPDCAGVALGVDRLLMLQQQLQRLDQVLCFPTLQA
tara:strand:+ start:2354 stop:3340 length:987 start_codon:yes stop_codon:yes gene_type:complete